jgi:hypothetical protein
VLEEYNKYMRQSSLVEELWIHIIEAVYGNSLSG